MSAQTEATATQNGVGSRDDPAPSSFVGPKNEQGPDNVMTQGELPVRSLDAGFEMTGHSGMQAQGSEQPSSGLQTAGAMQVEPQYQVPTTSDPDGRSSQEQRGADQYGQDSTLGFSTPRSYSGIRTSGQASWLSGVEVPRWMTRLGAFLQVPNPGLPAADLAPSPYPGGTPPFSPPPGGPTFRLRSPMRARPIPTAPTPPSSSSIPAEAIQAEVQRQLQGVMGQLREYGESNQRLRDELTEARAQLRAEQERSELAATMPPPLRLLGDHYNTRRDTVIPAMTAMPATTTYNAGTEPLRREVPSAPEDGYQGIHEGDRGVSGPTGLWSGEGRRGIDLPEPAPSLIQQPPSATSRFSMEAPGLLRNWWEARGRSKSPPARATAPEQASPTVLDALTKGIQQLQELQVQAMSKATSSSTVETVKPGTMALTPMPEAKEGAESALTFQDWLEISASTMSDISEASGTWWSGVIEQVELTYEQWLAATPLERLSIEPLSTETWTTGRWARVNARASTMIINAMNESLRVDMVARRATQNCVKMMFRAYTFYQPGGGAERHDVLKRLQNPLDYVSGDSMQQALQAVRAWPRWLERCRKVHMTPPDPSVLARGLMALTDHHMAKSSDANFRTAMLRTSLRLDGRPSIEQVVSYQRHLQAELEVLLSASTPGGGSTQPKLRGVESTGTAKAKDAGGKAQAAPTTELCRYFAKATGCKRGDRCSYSHSMSSMEKDVRARKCLKCGAESHRQKDCPVGRSATKATSPVKDGSAKPASTPAVPTSAQSTMATLGTSSTTTSSETIQGVPWTLESLIQAAQQVVQPQAAAPSREDSPEKTKPQVQRLKLRDIRVCTSNASTTALLDSGATHSLRTARSQEEWCTASEVVVQLAGNHSLLMRITSTGTLLMPYKATTYSPSGNQVQAQTIVPMGQLIQTLGYTMVWSKDECYLESECGKRVPLQVSGGCPQLQEMEALSMIARLEDRKREELDNAVLTTKDKLGVCALAIERTWEYYLMDYVLTGSFESGLRAVRDAPFFADLPGECLWEMIPTKGLWSGWEIMKDIGYFTRAQRRKILHSKRWVVHLFAGAEGHWEIMKLDQGDTTVIELDLGRCRGHDIFRDETWRMLMWGAKEGKIDVIIGGPPARNQQRGGGGEKETSRMSHWFPE